MGTHTIFGDLSFCHLRMERNQRCGFTARSEGFKRGLQKMALIISKGRGL
jgi:hypothetical protein